MKIPHRLRCLSVVLCSGILACTTARADFLDASLGGDTQTDGWENLTAANNPGYGSFPGAASWPAPIGSNAAGSGDAEFNKISGNGYPAGSSVYAPFTNTVFRISDNTAVANLETVVFQIQIGTAYGLDLTSAPTLSYNGGSQALTATFSQLVSSVANGDFGGSPTNLNTLAYQWDLSSVSEEITSFAIDWTVASHTQTYALQMDQGSVMSQLVAVPEPGTYAIAGGLLLLVAGRLRRSGFLAARN